MASPFDDTFRKTAACSADRRRVLRETIVLALAVALVAAVGVLSLWITASRMIRDNYGHYLGSLARTAALRVDPDLHARLRDPALWNGLEYTRAVAPLRQMLATLPDVSSIYTLVPDGDDARFVLDVAARGDHGDGIHHQARLWEMYVDRKPAMADKRGIFMTGWAPLLDAHGRQYGALVVEVDQGMYSVLLLQARHWALLGLLPMTALIGLLSYGFHRLRSRYLNAAREASQAERSLAGERKRLADTIDRIDIGTWDTVLDAQGIPETHVDARWAAMLGRRAEDLNPLRRDTFFPRLVHPDDIAGVYATMARTLQIEGKLLEYDVRMRHVDGHWIWTHVRGKVTERDEQGRPRRLVGTQHDATARKAVESALQESESNFRSLFELSPLGICLCEMTSGRYLKANDAMLAFTGYSRDELLRMNFWDLTPQDHHEMERGLHASIGPGTVFGPYEKEYHRKDGSRYPVLISGLRVSDASGRELAWAIVQDISKRKAMESELAAAANRDRLTGLANRSLFLQWLQGAIDRVRSAHQQGFAALFLDFDRFKLVNDAMGHEAGDALLREIASRLRSSLGIDTDPLDPSGPCQVARFGGDEFLVLLNDVSDGAAGQRIAEQLLAALSQPFEVKGREVFSTASIGIVTSDQCLESADAVVRNADVAMYEAKRSGRACAVLFDDAMRARLTRYVTIESQLRRALDTPEFSLVYQPIVDLATGRVTSVEALARWRHPTLGCISPAEFIPVAEESGLIVLLGQRVLQEACNALASWRAEDVDRAPQTICVNISRAELALGPRLLERISETLLRAGLPPQFLRLEVTERDAMRDPAASLQLMRALRAMGVSLAMDDFGTGTSSLGCLRDYPFDVIKIDRSFVSDLTTSPEVLALTNAAITLAQNLGKTSVAEGVETAAQRAILQSLGCQYGQGWYFSRPLTQDQMLEFIAPARAAPAKRA